VKHVPRIVREPLDLAQWRMDHPDDDRAPGAKAGAVWSRFKDSGPAYSSLLRALVDRQLGLCGYCEQRLTRSDGTLVVGDNQIEHVLAKSQGPGRTLDGANLMACCGGGTWARSDEPSRHAVPVRDNLSCGQAKGEHELAAACDPRSFPTVRPIVAVGLDGRLRAKVETCREARIDPEHLQHTIDERLRLNCERLRVARKRVIDHIVEWFVLLVREVLEQSPHLSDEAVASVERALVGGRLGPDANGHLVPFWSSERQYLGPAAEAWVREHGALLHVG